MSLRDQLRSFCERRYKVISVPGIEGPVIIQSITELERTEIVQRASNGHAGLIDALLIAACVVNDDHRRIYSDSKEDVDEIMRLDSRITQALIGAITDHVTPPALEDTVKN